jgi:uncharacterized membrane protein YphA (DoxX/SURF4 family)
MKNFRSTALWVNAIFLACLFVLVGWSKLEGPSAIQWAAKFSHWGYAPVARYVVAAIEIIGGFGFLFPRLRTMAAGAIMLVMVGAFITHIWHGEWLRLIPTCILGALTCVFLKLPSSWSQRLFAKSARTARVSHSQLAVRKNGESGAGSLDHR